jgi:hypothetical protein
MAVRRPLRWSLVAGALLVALVTPVGPAAAAPGQGGLAMVVHATDPLAPSVMLTNDTGAPCQIVTTAFGTVGVTSVGQSGAQVTPTVAPPSVIDAIGLLLADDVVTLAPGASRTIPLLAAPAGPTGHVVASVTAAGNRAVGLVYPVRGSGALAITATYSVPDVDTIGAPKCPPAAAGSVDTVAVATPSTGGVPWPLIGAFAAVFVILVLLVILLTRRARSRRSAAAGAAALLLLALVGALVWTARPAAATITPDPSLSSAFSACGGFNGDPAGILPSLNDPSHHIQIVAGDQTSEVQIPGVIIIYWNLNDHHPYFGGGSADPCSALYHEMFHAWQDLHGGQDHSDCYTKDGRDTGIPVNEVQAIVNAENPVRVARGLPPRTTYGKNPLPPDGKCYPPPRKPSPSPTPTPTPSVPLIRPDCLAQCGDSNADPHLRTFDGLRYNFQAAGEFVAVRDTADPGFEVQVRQQAATGSTTVAVTTAVAMSVAADRVEVDLTPDGAALLVGGKPTPLGPASLPHGGSVTLDTTTRPAAVDVAWPDGSTATVTALDGWGLHVTIRPAPAHAGKLAGLLGNDDGNPGDDLVTADGRTLSTRPDFGALYPDFADRWRITDATSLFTYPPSASTATYTDHSFPPAPSNLAGLPGGAAARAQCRGLGVNDPQSLDDCALDLAETGQATFAAADLDTQQLLGLGTRGPAGGAAPPSLPPPVLEPSGPTATHSLGTSQEATLTVTTPGGKDKVTFPAAKGQRLFVDILSATVPDQCGMVVAYGPDGLGFGNTCTSHGTGDYGGLLLPATGTYSLVFAPANRATGQARVRITLSTDVDGTIPTDGSPTTVSVDLPGQVGLFTFPGTVGDRVVVEATEATIPDQCAVPVLQAPDGGGIGGGCLFHSQGYVDGTLLTTNGQFAVRIDPTDSGTGQVTLRLVVSHDIHGTIALGGAPVTATIATSGQVAQYTFVGTKGERVKLVATGGTLPPQCRLPALLAPDGTGVNAVCTGPGDTGASDPIVLPAGGMYTVVVNPDGLSTGTLTFALRTG